MGRLTPPKTFNNPYIGVFYLYHTYNHKEDARRAEKELERNGYLAIVRITFGDRYSVYRRMVKNGRKKK